MSTLIAIVLLGLVFAFLATQNTVVTTFNILSYSWTQPMYIIVLGALLIGFLISWVVSSIGKLSTWSNVYGKDSKIRESQKDVTKLQSRIRELELENAKLQGHNEVQRREVVVEKPSHSFLDRFRSKPAY